jgi:four helix bundle protein
MGKPLRVLEAARAVVDEINALLIAKRGRLLNEAQLVEAAGSITANIREGFGRRAGPERNVFLRYSRASSEETDEFLRANHKQKLIPTSQYWRLHNRIAAIVKMLNKLMGPSS